MALLLGGSLPGCLQYSTAESGACTLAPWWGLRWTRRVVVKGGHGFRWVGIRKVHTGEEDRGEPQYHRGQKSGYEAGQAGVLK